MELGNLYVTKDGILVENENIFGIPYIITGVFQFRHMKECCWYFKF